MRTCSDNIGIDGMKIEHEVRIKVGKGLEGVFADDSGLF